MPDENKAGDGKDTKPIDNKTGNEGEADSKKTDTSKSQAFDPSKVGDEDFDKVFDDPRIWKHSRFASLREKAKKADEYEEAQKAAEEKRLAEAKKFEELATKRAAERDEWKGKYTNSIADNRITVEAAKQGALDLEAVLKLIDRTNIKVNDDGSITGIEDAVKALLEGKTYLKGKPGTVTIGSATNPGSTENAGKKFKLSQLQDPKFYKENEKEILEAYKNNLIEDDMAA